MTKKLTLTMEDKVINAAKKYAQKQGKSLSHLVENYLKSVTANEPKEVVFSQKVSNLLGVIKLPDDYNYKSELGKILAKKYSK